MKKRVFDFVLLLVAVSAFAFSCAQTALAQIGDGCSTFCKEITVWKEGSTNDCTKVKFEDCHGCAYSKVTPRCVSVPAVVAECVTPVDAGAQEWKHNLTCTTLCNIPQGVGNKWFVEAESPSDEGNWVKLGKQNTCKGGGS
jgi:hypothetical protein